MRFSALALLLVTHLAGWGLGAAGPRLQLLAGTRVFDENGQQVPHLHPLSSDDGRAAKVIPVLPSGSPLSHPGRLLFARVVGAEGSAGRELPVTCAVPGRDFPGISAPGTAGVVVGPDGASDPAPVFFGEGSAVARLPDDRARYVRIECRLPDGGAGASVTLRVDPRDAPGKPAEVTRSANLRVVAAPGVPMADGGPADGALPIHDTATGLLGRERSLGDVVVLREGVDLGATLWVVADGRIPGALPRGTRLSARCRATQGTAFSLVSSDEWAERAQSGGSLSAGQRLMVARGTVAAPAVPGAVETVTCAFDQVPAGDGAVLMRSADHPLAEGDTVSFRALFVPRGREIPGVRVVSVAGSAVPPPASPLSIREGDAFAARLAVQGALPAEALSGTWSCASPPHVGVSLGGDGRALSFRGAARRPPGGEKAVDTVTCTLVSGGSDAAAVGDWVRFTVETIPVSVRLVAGPDGLIVASQGGGVRSLPPGRPVGEGELLVVAGGETLAAGAVGVSISPPPEANVGLACLSSDPVVLGAGSPVAVPAGAAAPVALSPGPAGHVASDTVVTLTCRGSGTAGPSVSARFLVRASGLALRIGAGSQALDAAAALVPEGTGLGDGEDGAVVELKSGSPLPPGHHAQVAVDGAGAGSATVTCRSLAPDILPHPTSVSVPVGGGPVPLSFSAGAVADPGAVVYDSVRVSLLCSFSGLRASADFIVASENVPPVAHCKPEVRLPYREARDGVPAATFDAGSYDLDAPADARPLRFAAFVGREGSPSPRVAVPPLSGGYDVTLVAEDAGGLTNSCRSRLVIEPLGDPVARCRPAAVTHAQARAGVPAAAFDGGSFDPDGAPDLLLTATWALPGAAPPARPPPAEALSGVPPQGPIDVTLHVDDREGGHSTCSTTLEIDQPPVAVCRPEFAFVLPAGEGGRVRVDARDVDAGSHDDRGAVSVSVSPRELGEEGTHELVLTATDSAGQTSACRAAAAVVGASARGPARGHWRDAGLAAGEAGGGGGGGGGGGVAVSAGGDAVALGAAGAGTVRVMERGGGRTGWRAVGGPLTGPPGAAVGDRFGARVAVSADARRLAVQAPGGAGGAGAVYLYDRAPGGAGWDLSHTVTGPDLGPTAVLGCGVALSGDGRTLLVRVSDARRAFSKVRVLREGPAGAWEADGREWDGGAAKVQCGAQVALTGDGSLAAFNDTLTVRAVPSGPDPGRAAGGPAAREVSDDFYAGGVALSGDGAVVAAGSPDMGQPDVRGFVDVFRRVPEDAVTGRGEEWARVGGTVVATEPGDGFGLSLALSADGARLAVGSAQGARLLQYDEAFSREWVALGGGEVPGGGGAALSAEGDVVATGGGRAAVLVPAPEPAASFRVAAPAATLGARCAGALAGALGLPEGGFLRCDVADAPGGALVVVRPGPQAARRADPEALRAAIEESLTPEVVGASLGAGATAAAAARCRPTVAVPRTPGGTAVAATLFDAGPAGEGAALAIASASAGGDPAWAGELHFPGDGALSHDVTLRVRGPDGAVATCGSVLRVVDLPPVARCRAEVTAAAGGRGLAPEDVDAGSSDAFDGRALALSLADAGEGEVVLTVTDSQGQGSTCRARVTGRG